MKDLIEALTILAKYTDARHPTHCEHDVLYVPVVDHTKVSEEDLRRLAALSFHPDGDNGGFSSFRFGSC